MSERFTVKFDASSNTYHIMHNTQKFAQTDLAIEATHTCAALNAYPAPAIDWDKIEQQEAAQPKPEGETVDVRVAVVVAPDRRWKAYGGSGCSDAHSLAADALIDDVDDQLELASFFITASLPVPTTPEIPATVEPAKEQA